MTWRLAMTAVLALLSSKMAWAEEDVHFTLTNTSAQAVTGFSAAVPGEPEVALLSGALDSGSSQEIIIAGGTAVCVRHLRITFADTTVQERSDVDLCNMDGYVIE